MASGGDVMKGTTHRHSDAAGGDGGGRVLQAEPRAPGGGSNRTEHRADRSPRHLAIFESQHTRQPLVRSCTSHKVVSADGLGCSQAVWLQPPSLPPPVSHQESTTVQCDAVCTLVCDTLAFLICGGKCDKSSTVEKPTTAPNLAFTVHNRIPRRPCLAFAAPLPAPLPPPLPVPLPVR